MNDRVRDVMVLTVPRLAKDELEPLVEPDVLLPDDGSAKRFAKAFIFDDTPRMSVRDEVLDLMALADPLVGLVSPDDAVEETVWVIPDDGGEAEWVLALERESLTPEVPWEVPDEAFRAFSALMGTSCGFEEQPDWADVMSLVSALSCVEDLPFGDPDGSFDLPEECGFVSEFMGMGLISLPVPPEPVRVMMIAAPEAVPAIAAPAPGIRALSVPAPALPAEIPEHIELDEVGTEGSLQTSEEAEMLENTPLVMFSFGPQKVPEGGWRVSFSFRGRLRETDSPSPGVVPHRIPGLRRGAGGPVPPDIPRDSRDWFQS